MREKPIIFSTEMVKAILDGRKTQTRRLAKPQPEPGPGNGDYSWRWQEHSWEEANLVQALHESAPYQPGDVLWVRETFYVNYYRNEWPDFTVEQLREQTYYAADGLPDFEGEEYGLRWSPSIHMPRWAARIFLKVTAVLAERLQEITTYEAESEGTNPWDAVELRPGETSCIAAFRQLWNSIYSKRGLGWDANPWVWVYEFERQEARDGE